MKINKGQLFIISAPSGTGKTILCNRLLKTISGLKESISFTTRKPRKDETNNIDYTFVSVEEFMQLVKRNEFIEWAEVHGNYYGTSGKRLEEILDRGSDVLLDIDIQGARQIKKSTAFNTTFIFLLPPSLKILGERLYGRSTDSNETIKKRLEKSKEEIKEYENYDYVIINDNLEKALKELKYIIMAQKLRAKCINSDWIKDNF